MTNFKFAQPYQRRINTVSTSYQHRINTVSTLYQLHDRRLDRAPRASESRLSAPNVPEVCLSDLQVALRPADGPALAALPPAEVQARAQAAQRQRGLLQRHESARGHGPRLRRRDWQLRTCTPVFEV